MYELQPILDGLSGILTLRSIGFMLVGVVASSLFAAMPGVGSLLLLSMVIPFSMTLDPYECIALLLGIVTVSNTANTFSSVLIAVPGSSGSQATILDGFPMARNGEANRAFGAAFAASAMGALFGAMVFFLTLPIMRPLVLYFGSAALMMLVIWGLSAVAVLGGSRPLKGLMAAVLGLAIASVGSDTRTGIERFAFEEGGYLAEGFSVVTVALGIFAMPELISLSVRRTSVSRTAELGKGGLWRGCKDAFIHWWLVIRCSTVGVWIGILPGLGSSVADWFAYAHAVQSERDPEKFGTGDVRGVIAPESSNNAKEGGALIPTTMFGIPGSTAYALVLVAFIAVGIQPGRNMVTDQIHYIYAMIGVLVLANLFATGIALGFSNAFARISLLPFFVIVPMTVILCVIAGFNVSYTFTDLLALTAMSVLGFFMKRYGWPRPPLLVAVVLGPQLETYLYLTTSLYGMKWVFHADVLVIALVIAITLFFPMLRLRRERKAGVQRARSEMDISEAPVSGPGGLIMIVLFLVTLVLMAYQATFWPALTAVPIYAIAGMGLFLVALDLGFDLKKRLLGGVERTAPPPVDPARGRRERIAFAWILGLVLAIWLVGFHVAFFLFPILYVRVYGGSWRMAISFGVAAVAMLIGLFDTLIHVVWPEPYLLQLVSG